MAALTLAFFAPLAHADYYLSPTEERVRLSLGVVHTSTQTDLQVDSSTGVAGTWCEQASGTGCASIISTWIAPVQPP
jgi:hypothetical protein